jgi:predicted ATP-grasp superfamily ATP-dependent carboligase
MNLLVTNTRNAQAYGVIRSLRPHANKIVATMYGPNRFVARLSHAANSRDVDKRYFVPSPVEDWRRGIIQKNNTDREEAYIQEILRICEQEAIDVIFPSWEPVVYVFSKNKKRFQEKGIVLPIPNYNDLLGAMDKYDVIQKAGQIGFPCPKTFLFKDDAELENIERQLKYPIIIKPRNSSGSRGLSLVRDRTELLERISIAGRSQNTILMQEYVPGSQLKRFTSIWIVLDKNYKLIGSSLHRKLRTIFRDSASQGGAWESFTDDELIDAAAKLCQALRLNGPINIQTKLDPRDGLQKLIEVNPRIGYNFWIPLALGLDTPMLALNVARGEEFGAIEPVKGRTVFISPIQDTWAFMAYMVELFAAKVLGYHPIDAENSPPPLAEMLNSYRKSYTASRRVFDPYFSDFFRDPLVSLTWWAAFGFFNLQQKLPRFPSCFRRKRGQEVPHESFRHQHP